MPKSRRKYKSFTPEQKLAAVRQHLIDKIPVTEVCASVGIQPSVYYGWQKAFFERGNTELKPNKANADSRVKALEKKVKLLESRLTQKNDVLAELMEEHVAFKKKSTGGI